MDNRNENQSPIVYVQAGDQRWAMKLEGNSEPHWESSIMTNTDGEVKVNFYYVGGITTIY